MQIEERSDIKFITDTGIEVPAVTTEKMIEIDKIAMEVTGPNLYQMMENAGRNLASYAIDCLGEGWEDAKILVLAGVGGNGGGGICGARHLANRKADVFLGLSNPSGLGDFAAWQRMVFSNTPGMELSFSEMKDESFDLIIDALIGYRLQAIPFGAVLEHIRWANDSGTPILSFEAPSGVNSTTGEIPGEAISSKWTLSLGLPKTGLSHEVCGELVLADIGIPIKAYQMAGIDYRHPFGAGYRVQLHWG